MAQLHTISPKNTGRNKRRVGRGGKRGTYSGRGMKGQKSRSGARIRPAIRDLIKRFPKLRGDSASSNAAPETVTITLEQLSRVFGPGTSVTMKTLEGAGLVAQKTLPVKIVAGGSAPAKINLVGIPVSGGAKAAIEAAGGTVKALEEK